jgi:hypothetical protein
MHKNITQVSLLSVIGAIAMTISSCGVTKVAECNSMLAVANKAATANKNFTTQGEALAKSGKFQDPTQSTPLFSTLSSELTTVGKDMKALTVTDEKLTALKTRFVDLYEGMSKGLDTAVVDLKNKDAASYTKNWKAFGTVVAKEEPLVNEINTYCGAKKP